MDSGELSQLIEALRAHGADHFTCEVKKSKGGMPVTLWESISAFSNAAGGTLLLGVDEKSDFAVTGVDDPAAMESHIGAVCSEMEPPVRAEIQTFSIEGQQVVCCTVPPVPREQRPCHRRALGPWAGSRVRVADGDRKLTDYEVAVLLANRTEPRCDVSPVREARFEDLDAELISAFLRRIRETRGDIFQRVDDQRALMMLNVLTTHEEHVVPTLAGLLVFGIYPQTFQPQLDVTIVAYPTTEAGVPGRFGERFIENRSIDGPIPLIVAESIRVLKRNMRRRSIISGIYRVDEWEYPEEVLREALVNALVHRDYSEFARGTQVQVEMYPDRLVIRNPGGLYGPVEVGSLGANTGSSSRNKALLKILEDTPFGDGHMVCENRGTGIARMLVALTEAGMEPPRFTDDIALFTVEFPNHALLDEETLVWLTSLPVPPLSRSQMTALAMMRNGVVFTNSSYRAATGVLDSRTATRELKELVDAGVVEQTGTRGSTAYQVVRPAPEATRGNPRLSGNEKRILAALADGPLSRLDLEAATGLNKDQVHYGLQTLRGKGRIELLGKPQSRRALWRTIG
ncbi:putative DNA binding domain-containing protein [Actinoplanes sp. TRM 88003]|uniref:DNA binding domain-containing protein n=1 Tax=Paractinoplanes aksuensis TaxID=2939490 RepID=A0ABT1E2Q5_9ACTN|nr:ATP-binding protein [Actinoplanes aksuensis]MCO8277138.1 putative DNA binding domain-containing protein [Actinoplanes aksuensis]